MHKFRCNKLQVLLSSKMHKKFKDSTYSLFLNNFNNLKSLICCNDCFGLAR